MYIFSGDEGEKDVAQAVEGVSTDEMVNKNMGEKEWRAQSEAQMMSMDTNMRTLANRAQRADQLEQQLAQARAGGSSPIAGGGLSPQTEPPGRLRGREPAPEGRACGCAAVGGCRGCGPQFSLRARRSGDISVGRRTETCWRLWRGDDASWAGCGVGRRVGSHTR